MLPANRFLTLLCLALALVPTSAESAEKTPAPPPINAFFGLPGVAQPRLSPNGAKIAFLFPNEGKLALGVFDRKTNEARLILKGTDESIGLFFWKGDDRIVFSSDVGGNESFFIGSTDLTGKKVLRIVESQPGEFIESSAGRIVDVLRADPDRIVVQGLFRGGASETSDVVLARVNVKNRGISTVYTYHASDRTGDIVVDRTGALRLRSRHTAKGELIWEHRANDDQPWREIARHPFNGYAETWRPLSFAADPLTLWLVSREEHDRGALYAYNTRTFERGPAVFVPPAGEIDSLVLNYDESILQGVVYETEKLNYHWFDEGRRTVQASVEAAFPGMEVRITSSSADEKVWLMRVGSDREPGVYFVLDRTAGSLVQFKRIREIDPRTMAPMEPVTFAARDGLALHGYLTRPLGHDGKRTPLILHPHGGPFGVRDSWGFNPEVQFLASRGYAVLQVNYRGSGGYGREFLNQGKQQWGRAMQDDLTDAVKWAIAQGYADPARVAIYGASYGGYATLVGLTLTPELYRCGVNYVGASDLDITFKNRGDDAYTTGDDFSYQREWVGATAEWRAATSPVNFVQNIRVPSLHAYGEKDPRVKIDHWSRLEAQLKKFGKPYESVTQKRQGHGFREEKASLGFYGTLEKFLAEHLGPAGNVKVGETKVIDLPAKN